MQNKGDEAHNEHHVHAKLEQVEQQLKDFKREAIQELQSLRRKFERRFHLLYILIAFTGITLVWYGLWTIISDIPVINNPYVATGLGIVILLLLGKFFNWLI